MHFYNIQGVLADFQIDLTLLLFEVFQICKKNLSDQNMNVLFYDWIYLFSLPHVKNDRHFHKCIIQLYWLKLKYFGGVDFEE